MAACTFNRVDSLETTTTVGKHCSRLWYNATEQKFMVLWREVNGIRFAYYDPATDTPSGEVLVSNSGTPLTNQRDNPILVPISDTHLFAIFYGNSSRTVCSESTDGGVTWGPEEFCTGTNDRICAAYFDGTQVVIVVVGLSSGGVGAGDYGYAKSTGTTNVWPGSATKFYDSGGLGSQTPGTADTTALQQARDSLYMASATTGFFLGVVCTDATPTLNRMKAWYTTDGWANSTMVTVKVNTAAFTGVQIVRAIGTRVWAVWNDSDNGEKPYLAYTDDVGATWTLVGTPTVVTNQMAALGISSLDPTYDLGMGLDIFDNIILTHTTAGSLNPGTHNVYRSADDPTDVDDWVLATTCTYASNVDPRPQTLMTSPTITDPQTGATYRLLCCTLTDGATRYSLQFVELEGLPPEPEPNPEQPVSEASGADDNSLYLRNCLALGGGWSAHTVSVAYFMDWDEGDRETGAQVNMLLAASPSMDPAIQNPELIAGFTRLDADGYTSRTYTATSSDATTIREDPFSMRVYTKLYSFKQAFERNVARGFLVTWQRNGGSIYEERNFPNPDMAEFSIWVDDRHLQTIRLWNTGEDRVSKFFPLNTWGNVGEEFQIRIQDGSPWEFHIDAIGMMYMPKKIRG